ncbi:MAG: 23S rRNA (pseudouridine(1915)-N(3))-methyltransferase RlmH [Bacteroidetes bacterium]|nr:23S rRNA (pseudouridine(1915)-N(3))-methyltransferase RlmH [Bacteroidota bacterium]
MKVELWCLGKNTLKYLDSGISDYEKRLKHYVPFSLEVFSIPSAKKNEIPENIKRVEAEIILKKLQPTDHLVLLDELGKHYSSTQFSQEIQQYFNHVNGRLIFLIGGAFGFSDDVYNRANAKISFSKMTMNHLLFRLVFLEQFYRAMTILKGEPYHH